MSEFDDSNDMLDQDRNDVDTLEQLDRELTQQNISTSQQSTGLPSIL